MKVRLPSDLNYQYNIFLTEIGWQEYSGITHKHKDWKRS